MERLNFLSLSFVIFQAVPLRGLDLAYPTHFSLTLTFRDRQVTSLMDFRQEPTLLALL